MVQLIDLPGELLDAILDQLDVNRRSDKKALVNCSLVCKSFYHLSRRYLFRATTIHMLIDTDDEDDEENEMDGHVAGAYTPSRILQFFVDHYHIIRHIEELSLENQSTIRLEDPYPAQELMEIFSHLPQLKVLRLKNVIVERLPPNAKLPTLRLDKLAIAQPTNFDEGGTLDAIGLFESVDVLEITEIEFEAFAFVPHTQQVLGQPTSIRPHTLILRDVSSITPFLNALETTGVTLHVTSLSVHRIETLDELHAVSRILDAICENLVYLDIDFDWADEELHTEDEGINLDATLHLNRSKNLHTLVVCGPHRTTSRKGWNTLRQLIIACQQNTGIIHEVRIEHSLHDLELGTFNVYLEGLLSNSQTSPIITITRRRNQVE